MFYFRTGGTTESKGHKLILLGRLILALVKVLAGLDVIFETIPREMSHTKMALEYILQIGLLIN